MSHASKAQIFNYAGLTNRNILINPEIMKVVVMMMMVVVIIIIIIVQHAIKCVRTIL